MTITKCNLICPNTHKSLVTDADEDSFYLQITFVRYKHTEHRDKGHLYSLRCAGVSCHLHTLLTCRKLRHENTRLSGTPAVQEKAETHLQAAQSSSLSCTDTLYNKEWKVCIVTNLAAQMDPLTHAIRLRGTWAPREILGLSCSAEARGVLGKSNVCLNEELCVRLYSISIFCNFFFLLHHILEAQFSHHTFLVKTVSLQMSV